MAQDTIVVERVVGCCGELVLQRSDGHYEIVANGVFLMDTRGGGSERLHVTVAADRMPPLGRMLIGGLGVGFSLAAALAHPAWVRCTSSSGSRRCCVGIGARWRR